MPFAGESCCVCGIEWELFLCYIPDPYTGQEIDPSLRCEKHSEVGLWYKKTPYNRLYHARVLNFTTCQINIECTNIEHACHDCGKVIKPHETHGYMCNKVGDVYCRGCWNKQISDKWIKK